MDESDNSQENSDQTRDVLRGMATAAYAVGLEDHRRMLHRNDDRVRDGYERMREAAGFAPRDKGETVDDEMGDIIVTGDIYGSSSEIATALNREEPPGSPQPQPAPQTIGKLAKWGAVAAALAMGAGGIGAGIGLMSLLNQDSPAIVAPPQEDSDRSVRLRASVRSIEP